MDWKEWRSDNPDAKIRFEYRVRQKGYRRSYLLFFGIQLVTDPVVLPVGNPDDDFRNEVVIYIMDSIGDYEIHIIEVKVVGYSVVS